MDVKSDPVKIITTSDGSHTLFNARLNETYHSQHGAVQESKHVFIDNGLKFVYDRPHPGPINILEVGFGTGLNAWLSFQFCDQNSCQLFYTSLEPFPLDEGIWSQLNYVSSDSDRNKFRILHTSPWGTETMLAPNFKLRKLASAIQETTLLKHFYDIIYFDAFAPSKQPEMWEMSVLSMVVAALGSDGIIVSYCAKGQFKRDLKALGLNVETLAGPPGKKEMTRAIKS